MQVTCVNERFSPNKKGATKFLATVKQKLAENPGKPTILLFPEAVLQPRALPRTLTKAVARELHALAAQHGNALIAYSAIEDNGKTKNGAIKISNTGYLVSSAKTTKGLGYQAYPKITTYSGDYRLPQFDYNVVYAANSEDYQVDHAIEHWARRAKRVRRFPSIIFNGQKVGLSVCVDSTMENEREPHNANNEKFDLLLVPASNLRLNAGLTGEMQGRLNRNGTAVIMDNKFGQIQINAVGARSQDTTQGLVQQMKPKPMGFFRRRLQAFKRNIFR